MLFRPLYQFPTWLQRLYPGATWRRSSAYSAVAEEARGTIYITFDDGPIPEVTPRILEILREKNVKATWFMVGDNVRKYPQLLDLVRQDGHAVGNHTFHHLPGLQTSLAEYLEDVTRCDELVHSRLFRPPYGRSRLSQRRELRNAGYEVVLWDVLTHDYNPHYTPERMMTILRKYSRPGSIVVFHDSIRSNERMLQTLPMAIDWWREQGYVFATL